MPRVAALLDVSQVSDIVKVISPDTFLRPIYAGNAFATVKSNDSKKCVTIRPTSFDPAQTTGGSAEIVKAEAEEATTLNKFIKREILKKDLRYGYRSSKLDKTDLVISAIFKKPKSKFDS